MMFVLLLARLKVKCNIIGFSSIEKRSFPGAKPITKAAGNMVGAADGDEASFLLLASFFTLQLFNRIVTVVGLYFF